MLDFAPIPRGGAGLCVRSWYSSISISRDPPQGADSYIERTTQFHRKYVLLNSCWHLMGSGFSLCMERRRCVPVWFECLSCPLDVLLRFPSFFYLYTGAYIETTTWFHRKHLIAPRHWHLEKSSSADWTQKDGAFLHDLTPSRCLLYAFFFDFGIIYKAPRPDNSCCQGLALKCQTDQD